MRRLLKNTVSAVAFVGLLASGGVGSAGLGTKFPTKFLRIKLAGAGVGLPGLGAAQTSFPLSSWTNYQTIMWIGDSAYRQPDKLPLFFQRLREMGINTAMVYGDGDPRPVAQNGFHYYVENIVNRGLCLKWNSKVRDWDGFVTEWARAGRSASGLVRDYCLDDPEWRGWAEGEVRRAARKNRDFHPLAYDLRDELSTTFCANPFDYDFNPMALAGFRQWLKTQYGDLAALNAEWDTQFANWENVRPFTTDEIKNRMASGQALPGGHPDWQALEALKFDPATAGQAPVRWNFSPWADFRTYMDLSLARVLGELRAAAHEVDSGTPVGIEGTQMPHAFGGYDLWRLSGVLDWVEPYDIGNAREIFGSFMPGRPIVTTVFESDTAHARRRLWHLLLEGDRGCIVWWSEDCLDWRSADYQFTAKARALMPALKEMTSPLAALFLQAEPERDPVYLLYSQPSIQADWLLESTVDGSTWLRRFSSYEADHNEMVRARNAWLRAMEDAGCSPQFLSTEDLEAGRLRNAVDGALVLSDCYALSAKAIGEIDAFRSGLGARAGANDRAPVRELFWDRPFGQFDEHCKLRAGKEKPSDLEVQGKAHCRIGNGVTTSAPEMLAEWVGAQLRIPFPRFGIPPAAHVRVRRFRLPSARLLAFERDIHYRMNENLSQAAGNEALEKPLELNVTLPEPRHVYDLRTEAYLGFRNQIHFVLDPWQPSLFALTARKLPPGSIVAHLRQQK